MRFFSLLAHILFPASCLCCQKRTATHYLCDSCRDHLPSNIRHICPYCQKKKTNKGQVCVECLEKCPLDGVYSAFSYKDELVKECVHALKYQFIESLAEPLGMRLAHRVQYEEIPLCDSIIPVPLHPLRFRWRGFNQAECLAKHFSKHLLSFHPLPIRTDLLIRKRFTAPQTKTLSRKEREKNMHNAFLFKGSSQEIRGKILWLLDDVSTTNSTLSECARILKKNGAKEVWGITLAR